MIVAFALIVLIVTFLVIFSPTRLLYGKEEHVKASLAESAIRDSVKQLIADSVKPECLKKT